LAKEDYLLALRQRIAASKEFDSLSRDGSATTLLELLNNEIQVLEDLRDMSDPFWKGVKSAIESTVDLNWEFFLSPLDSKAKSQRLHQHLARRLAKLKALL
jgi:hypothetical protein